MPDQPDSSDKNIQVHHAAKPFLKWAGGKSQLLPRFRELYPKPLLEKKIKTYFEPFLGSGAVFFDVAQKFDIDAAYLYDINEELVLVYTVVQKDVSKLTEALYQMEKAYSGLNKDQRTAYYYQQRTTYNHQHAGINYNKYSAGWICRAAQVIFLNRTCFNGLFRVNAKGAFNTPAGDYANPTICDEHNLLAVSKVLAKAEIKQADFRQVVHHLKDNAFIYLDPPYRPLSKTASFKAYSRHGFGDKEQQELAHLCLQLSDAGLLLMLSNSDPKNIDPADSFFDDLYKGFHIHRVPARRMINADASKRGAVNELVITNY